MRTQNEENDEENDEENNGEKENDGENDGENGVKRLQNTENRAPAAGGLVRTCPGLPLVALAVVW